MSSKTQPEEHEVLSAIETVLAQNPEFGVKRVSVVLKEQNPEWALSEKRVTKLLKKHKSVKITLDDGDSDSTSDDSPKAAAAAPSPWNVAPTAAPAAHDPWNSTVVVESATSAFNAVTEAATKAVETASSAFNVEPVAEPTPAVHNPWNTAPVHDKTFTETVKEHATAAVEQVKETTSKVVAATPGFVEDAKDAVVDAAAKVHDKAEDVVDDIKDDAPGFFEKIKDAAEDAVESIKDTAEDAVEKVKEATSSAPSPWNAAPVETVAFVAEPVKEIVVPVAAPVVVEEPKKEAWNFTPVKEEAAKIAENLEESAKSTIEKIEDAASAASEKVKEEAAAAVVVIKKAESAVEDKLAEAKVAAESLVGYDSASVAPKKDKRPTAEKEVEGSACGGCTQMCSIM